MFRLSFLLGFSFVTLSLSFSLHLSFTLLYHILVTNAIDTSSLSLSRSLIGLRPSHHRYDHLSARLFCFLRSPCCSILSHSSLYHVNLLLSRHAAADAWTASRQTFQLPLRSSLPSSIFLAETKVQRLFVKAYANLASALLHPSQQAINFD